MYRLARYQSIVGDGEYVVILSEGENEDDYCNDGYRVNEVIDIECDASSFPTDRILVAK